MKSEPAGRKPRELRKRCPGTPAVIDHHVIDIIARQPGLIIRLEFASLAAEVPDRTQLIGDDPSVGHHTLYPEHQIRSGLGRILGIEPRGRRRYQSGILIVEEYTVQFIRVADDLQLLGKSIGRRGFEVGHSGMGMIRRDGQNDLHATLLQRRKILLPVVQNMFDGHH